MVSIKKFLLFAILASVLIGAVCVKAEEASDSGKEPAKEEVSAEKPEAGSENSTPGESAHKTVTDFGKKIFSGFKNAGKTIFSHIPFFSHGAASEKPAGSEAAPEASNEASTESKPEAAEDKKEKKE